MQRISTGSRPVLVLAVLTTLIAAPAFALDLGPGQSVIALKWGRTGRGTASIENVSTGDREVAAGSGSVLGIAFDFPLSRKLSAGVAVDWWLKEEGQWPSINLTTGNLNGVELAAQLKGLISFHDGRFAIRPGIGLGGFQGHYSILALRAGVELQASITSTLGLGVETGVWHGPLGTDDNVDISIGPLGFMRVQLLIATGSRGHDK